MSKPTDPLAGTTLSLHPHGAPQIDASAIATVTLNGDVMGEIRPRLTIAGTLRQLGEACECLPRVSLCLDWSTGQPQWTATLDHFNGVGETACAAIRRLAGLLVQHMPGHREALVALVADLEGR